jgi:Skp family chaperone for outer membrane proteins
MTPEDVQHELDMLRRDHDSELADLRREIQELQQQMRLSELRMLGRP